MMTEVDDVETWQDERQLLLLPSQITAVRRYADNSGGVSFRSTLELSAKEMAVLDIFLRNKTVGQLAFAANKVSLGDIPQEDASEDGRKSQGQLERALLWHLWNQNTDRTEDSEVYIRRRRQWFIDRLKEELDG